MNLNLNDYEFLEIDSIEIEEKETSMYDIEVEDDNTFFISKNKKDNILVHNCDGNHIRGLLINLFDTFWPELLQMDFVYDFATPIVKASKGKVYKYYYKLNDYLKDKDKLNGYDIKWIKGLGTIEPHEMKEFFKNIKKHLVRFHYDKPETEELFDMLFNKKRADDRKNWLLEYKPADFIDKFTIKQTYDKFINDEYIEFSMYDNIRSIQNVIDGFKPSQRKAFSTLIKKNIKNEIKVSSLSGSAIEMMAYHHGNQSIEETIIGMAQDFVGTNNINLLSPKGQFGTRIKGGSDSASPRYIFTKLSDITSYIFREEDNDILDYLEDDGMMIEPRFYVPIIPMILVNGSFGIGTGYSSDVPMFNPLEIISYLLCKLQGKKTKDINPYYKGFKGEIIYDTENKRCITRGIYDKLNANVIKIRELPIGMWNDKYFEKLDKMIEEKKIRDYSKNCTDTDIDIKIILTKENMDELMSSDNIYKLLNIETYISLDNMHLFNKEGKIKKYKDQYEVVDEFMDVRLDYYQKRKEYQLNELQRKIKIIQNRMKFLKLVISGELIIYKKSREYIENQLVKHKFELIDDSYNYLMNMSISSFTMERLQDLKEEYDKTRDSYKKLDGTSIESIWIGELSELKSKIKI